jgi:hypothetical protein
MHTIWCDDVRQEIGNKPSFMGVYTGSMVLESSLPFTLPRLFAWTWVVCEKASTVRKMTLSVERDDGTALLSLPDTDFPAVEEDGPFSELKRFRFGMFGLAMVPFVIPAGCKYFLVKVKLDDGTVLEGNKLWIQPTETNPVIPEIPSGSSRRKVAPKRPRRVK